MTALRSVISHAIALASIVLSMFGCNTRTETFVHHLVDGGIEQLHSRVTLRDGVAHLRCVAGVRGCHYSIRPPGCVETPGAGAAPRTCPPGAPHDFVLMAGAALELPVTGGVRLCVGPGASRAGVDCTTLGTIGPG